MNGSPIRRLVASMMLLSVVSGHAQVRIKDISRVEGTRDVQLIGYGLVVGLDGTGDRAKAMMTVHAVANMLSRMGVSVPEAQMRVRNVASVVVTAKAGSFVRKGTAMDAVVSALGDATSLKGGTLLLTPLRGLDGTVAAFAQGPLTVEGRRSGYLSTPGQCTGRVVEGAIVQRDMEAGNWLLNDGATTYASIALFRPDFTTAERIAASVNGRFPGTATAIDPGIVRITVPAEHASLPVRFLAMVESLPVEPDGVARIVINERTGTVVMGNNITVSPVAVSHNNVQIEIGTSGKDPGDGTVVLKGASVDELVTALNTLGFKPGDIISIFKAIKRAGGIQAELELM